MKHIEQQSQKMEGQYTLQQITGLKKKMLFADTSQHQWSQFPNKKTQNKFENRIHPSAASIKHTLTSKIDIVTLG